MTAELILDARNGTGESPVWHVAEQALYWVDIPGKTINRWSPQAGHRQWATQEMPACIAATATPGRWIAGMETVWVTETGPAIGAHAGPGTLVVGLQALADGAR